MKKRMGILLVLLALVSMSVAPTAEAVFGVHTVASSLAIKNLETRRGIETKENSEVFSIIKNENDVIFDYIDEVESLSFRSAVSTARSNDSIVAMDLTETDSGFLVQYTVTEESNMDLQPLIVDLPAYWTLDYVRSEDGSIINGSLGIYNESGNPVASTGLAHATDSSGNEVDATFVVEDKNIKVSLNDENISYPISVSYGVYATNASKSITDYFSYSGYNLVYDGSLTLGERYFDMGSVIECTNAWDAVYALYFPYSPYWTTATQTESMNDQYWCHADYAKNKDQWNLEPWRPVVDSWADMVIAACNPE